MIGTGQSSCVSDTADPTASGHMAAFDPSGQADSSFATGGVAHFRSPMQGEVWAFSDAGGGVLMVGMPAPVQVENNPDSPEILSLVALSGSGGVDPHYGAAGRAQLRLFSLVNNSPGSLVPITVTSQGRTIVVVASTANGKGLQLIKLLS